MRYIFSILVVVCLLFSATPVGDGFIAATGGLHLEGLKILITEVHEPEWKIAYRYGAECKPEDRQNDEALKAAISDSLRAWLEPLKALNPERPIVDSFVYELWPDYNPNQSVGLEKALATHLRVTFECTQATSVAQISRGKPPGVIMRQGTETTFLQFSALIHELGHSFGLADTYQRPGFMRSRGGLDRTAGNQPASMMAMAGHFHRETPITIGEDDKRGIVWLYKYFYEDLASDDCFFADYVFEEEPRGCIAKYPLIFETKHNHPRYAVQLLEQDPTVDVNAQDVGGMTALHYAVMYEKDEVVKALLAHQDISHSLKNKQGQTPLDIALTANQTAILKMFPDPPRRKEDVNGDGVVNILDLVAVSSKFGQKDAGTADVNGDGAVDIRDLVLVTGAFGAAASAPALQVE